MTLHRQALRSAFQADHRDLACGHPYPVVRRRGDEGEPADHDSAHQKVHLAHRRRRALALQDLEVVAVVRLDPRFRFEVIEIIETVIIMLPILTMDYSSETDACTQPRSVSWP